MHLKLNPKLQIPNPKALPTAKSQGNSQINSQLPADGPGETQLRVALGFAVGRCLGIWQLGVRWDLELGIWDLPQLRSPHAHLRISLQRLRPRVRGLRERRADRGVSSLPGNEPREAALEPRDGRCIGRASVLPGADGGRLRRRRRALRVQSLSVNPKLQVPNPKHSQPQSPQPTLKFKSQPIGNWLGIGLGFECLGAWDLDLGI